MQLSRTSGILLVAVTTADGHARPEVVTACARHVGVWGRLVVGIKGENQLLLKIPLDMWRWELYTVWCPLCGKQPHSLPPSLACQHRFNQTDWVPVPLP